MIDVMICISRYIYFNFCKAFQGPIHKTAIVSSHSLCYCNFFNNFITSIYSRDATWSSTWSSPTWSSISSWSPPNPRGGATKSASIGATSWEILYSTKLWRKKTLVDLVVHCQSARVLSAKMLWDLVSSNIEWAFPLPTAKVFSANFLAVPIPPKFCAIRYATSQIPHAFPMEKQFKSMTLKLTTEQIGG